MSQTINGVPDDSTANTETISPTVDPDIFMSMVEDAERRMLEICAERLGNRGIVSGKGMDLASY